MLNRLFGTRRGNGTPTVPGPLAELVARWGNQPVPVPGWAGVFVKPLAAADVLEFARQRAGLAEPDRLALLFVLSVCDEHGNRTLTAADIPTVRSSVRGALVDAVIGLAMKLNDPDAPPKGTDR